jgi:hypothetical protein
MQRQRQQLSNKPPPPLWIVLLHVCASLHRAHVELSRLHRIRQPLLLLLLLWLLRLLLRPPTYLSVQLQKSVRHIPQVVLRGSTSTTITR